MHFGCVVACYQVLLLIEGPHSDDEDVHLYCHGKKTKKQNTDDRWTLLQIIRKTLKLH